MKNVFLKSVIVLTAICLVASVILAVTNHVTAPLIAKAQLEATEQAMQNVMPGSAGFTDVTPEGAPETVETVSREESGMGYVVTLRTSSQYSKSDMLITVGISSEGAVTGIEITNYSETKDFGEEYPQEYIGLDSEAVSGADTFAGVTYSSTAFKNAICDAFTAYGLVCGEGE